MQSSWAQVRYIEKIYNIYLCTCMITYCPGSGLQLMIMLSLLINFQMFFLISSLKCQEIAHRFIFYCPTPNDIKMTVINEEKSRKCLTCSLKNWLKQLKFWQIVLNIFMYVSILHVHLLMCCTSVQFEGICTSLAYWYSPFLILDTSTLIHL